MTNNRRTMVFIGICALTLGAIIPTQVADGRLPRWTNIVWDIRQGTARLASLTRSLFARPGKSAPIVSDTARRDADRQDPNSQESASQAIVALPAAPPTATTPVLGALNAIQAVTVLDKAFAAAAATQRLKALGIDPTGIREVLIAYHAGDLAGGDATAKTIIDTTVRAALDWVAVHDVSTKIGMERLNTFAAAHADWPIQSWARRQIEARFVHVQDMAKVEAFFTRAPPVSAVAKLAFAHAMKANGHGAEATRLARAIYRDADLSLILEGKLKGEFGGDLQKADYKYRADRLLYKDDVGTALRVATAAGPDVLALAKARAAVIAEGASDKAIAAVPAPLRADPGFLLAQIQKLRRADKIKEAGVAMLAAPHDPVLLINGDEWWTERRVLARKLLDTGDAQTAYKICAAHSAVSAEAKIEAEFHAGWIALRFLGDAATAIKHFDTAALLTATPTSIARIAYWQGRAIENSVAPDALDRAKPFYEKAARYPSVYYGQLARAVLGPAGIHDGPPSIEPTGSNRAEATRVIEILFGAGEKDAATALATEAAQTMTDPSQIAAMSTVIENQQDAHLALTLGKIMSQRGFSADALAFPTFGIPRFEPIVNSAPASVVYSVARQESAFNPTVVSSAGAKGLMQMIDSTAKRTAVKAGLAFDETRMLTDAAFNARLGAAHLGALLAEQGGSYILTFAAYNAGGGRVKQWIDSYGDPRNPGVDPVDWVERIPFTETRNYVQRVIANVTTYQARFADDAAKTEAARTRDAQARL